LIILLAILVFAFLLRIHFFVGMGFNDDTSYTEYANSLMKNKLDPLIHEKTTWVTRVGVYLPIYLTWKLFGVSEFSTSLYFLLSSIGSIVVCYLLGKKLFDSNVGLISAFLLSIFPLNIIYSTQIGPDIPFQFLSTLSVLVFILFETTLRRKYAIFTGFLFGVLYLIKSTVFLIFPILILYSFITYLSNPKGFFSKERVVGYSFVLLSFFLVFSLQLVYFHNLTGRWFFLEDTRRYSLTHDMNSNSDVFWYIRDMFNLKSKYFTWIHDLPLFGFIFYFVLLASIYLVIKRNVNGIFLVLWILFIFSFFEFGIQFICTKVFSYCLYARHPRFLTIISIPSIILVGKFLSGLYKKHKFIVIFLLIFILTTNMFYTYYTHTFLRSEMNRFEKLATFIKENKITEIYVPDSWSVSKLRFFIGYNDSIRIKSYSCDIIECSKRYYNYSLFLNRTYVVVNISPYEVSNPTSYPLFKFEIPSKWKLIREIGYSSYGIFNGFSTKIFYTN